MLKAKSRDISACSFFICPPCISCRSDWQRKLTCELSHHFAVSGSQTSLFSCRPGFVKRAIDLTVECKQGTLKLSCFLLLFWTEKQGQILKNKHIFGISQLASSTMLNWATSKLQQTTCNPHCKAACPYFHMETQQRSLPVCLNTDEKQLSCRWKMRRSLWKHVLQGWTTLSGSRHIPKTQHIFHSFLTALHLLSSAVLTASGVWHFKPLS